MRMPMPPACAHVCSNVSINASAYRFVYAYANAPAVYPNGAFCQQLTSIQRLMLEIRVSCRLSLLASPAPLSHISPLFSFSSPSYLLSLSNILSLPSPLITLLSPLASRCSLLSLLPTAIP